MGDESARTAHASPEAGQVHDASLRAGHEVSDADAGPLIKMGIGMAVIMLVAFVGIVILLRTLLYLEPVIGGENQPHPLIQSRTVYNGPRLQPDPSRELTELRAESQRLLTTYGWVDKKAGVARIPVARAIHLLAERGLGATSSTAARE